MPQIPPIPSGILKDIQTNQTQVHPVCVKWRRKEEHFYETVKQSMIVRSNIPERDRERETVDLIKKKIF